MRKGRVSLGNAGSYTASHTDGHPTTEINNNKKHASKSFVSGSQALSGGMLDGATAWAGCYVTRKVAQLRGYNTGEALEAQQS